MSVAKVKKGDTVIMCGFTGMKLGVYSVVAADEKKITVEKTNGDKVSFSRKDGKQIGAKNPKYANSIMVDDGSYVDPRAAVKKAAKGKKASDDAKTSGKKAKKAKDEEEEEVEEEIEDEEEEEEKPSKKSSKKSDKKVSKKSKKADDDDDYEEVE